MIDRLPRMLSDRQVADLIGIHRSTVHSWVARGILPRPIRISTGCSRWRAVEIESFIDRRDEESRAVVEGR